MFLPSLASGAAPMQIKDLPPLVPGTLDWDWVGNTHSDFQPGDGDDDGNGDGRWVQNGMDEMEVTPDGTVAVGTAIAVVVGSRRGPTHSARAIRDAGRPSAVAMVPDGRLVICDDGEC